MKSGSGVGGRGGGDGSRGGGLVDTRLVSRSEAFASIESCVGLLMGLRSRKLGPFDLRHAAI